MERRLRSGLAASLTLIWMPSCLSAIPATDAPQATSYCQLAKKILVSRKDVLTSGTKKQIVESNLTYECTCSQPRPAICEEILGTNAAAIGE